jgi:hypothetical protein
MAVLQEALLGRASPSYMFVLGHATKR